MQSTISNTTKRLVSAIVLAAILFLGFGYQQAAAEEIGADFESEEAVSDELSAISEKYDVGEFLSAEDAVFVETFATPTEEESNPLARNVSNFSKTKTKYGTTVNAKGKLFHNGYPFNYSFGCDVTIKKTKGKTPKKLSFKANCTGYGVGAAGGKIFVSYKGSLSASKNNASTLRADLKKTYSAPATALYSIDSYARITTHSGDVFTISD